MDSIPGPFTIEINGQPISKFDGPIQDSDTGFSEGQHAKVGSEPAVFELHGSRLVSDGHLLTRNIREDLSLMPKRVVWFEAKDHNTNHRVVAEKTGNSYSLKISNATLTERDGAIYADIINQEPERVVVRMLA